jgi:hypothetical protein
MIGAAQRYRELIFDLVLRRELAGGALAPAEEARLVSELDRCWNAMTDEEQEDMERELAEQAPPSAPETLAAEDRAVERGAHLPPRKAA